MYQIHHKQLKTFSANGLNGGEQGIRILLKKSLKWSEHVAPAFQELAMVSEGLFRSQDGPKLVPRQSQWFQSLSANKLWTTHKRHRPHLKN